MADRSDLITVTLTKYEDSGWPIVKLLGKWRRTPLGIRKLGDGRYALDTYKGVSLVLEFWWIR
jgi:hypothetical protein